MCIFRKLIVGTALVAITASTQCLFADQDRHSDEEAIERGRYLTQIAGCNDCHTPGYMDSGGKVPQDQWLIGSNLGWRGAWGTTYPSNLRLYLQRIPEEKWVTIAHTTQYRPPMPWFDLRDMSEEDLRAIYRFVTYLGPAGEPAPAYLPPDQEPKGPYVQFPQPPK
jgi:mono/diheme cytochrome c family protein